MLTINCRGKLLSLHQPMVMGILNTTPDSFYKESRTATLDQILSRAAMLLDEGASIIDMGGQSTRPGAERVSAAEESGRIIPAIEAVAHQFPHAIISVDTFYASVAREAIAKGAVIINDVSAGSIDPEIQTVAADLQVPYVLMHMQGDPQNMQKAPFYKDVVKEVFDYLNFQAAQLQNRGIKDIIIDPGFGYGKTQTHNFQLMQHLEFFQQLHRPLLVGISRKGMVYRNLGNTPEEALNGSTVLHTVSLMKGAQLLRVHDVKEAVEAIKLISLLNNAA